MPDTKSATKATSSSRNSAKGFTAEERAAMQERARELKVSRGKDALAAQLADQQAKIAELTGSDRDIAERLHEIIMAAAPELEPKTYYGMPAWARNGKNICFFQPASKFKARYGTLGFTDEAKIDDGEFFPTSWGVFELSAADEKTVTQLIKRALA